MMMGLSRGILRKLRLRLYLLLTFLLSISSCFPCSSSRQHSRIANTNYYYQKAAFFSSQHHAVPTNSIQQIQTPSRRIISHEQPLSSSSSNKNTKNTTTTTNKNSNYKNSKNSKRNKRRDNVNNINKKRRVNYNKNNSDNNMIHEIEQCYYAFKLSQIIRSSPNLFVSSPTTSSNNSNITSSSEALSIKLETLAPSMSARDISGLLNCISKQRVTTTQRHIHRKSMKILADAAKQNIEYCNARHISMTVNSLSKHGDQYHDEELFDLCANRSIELIHTFNSQGLANTVNAFAKRRHTHPILFDAVASAAIPILHTFNSQELANTANAYAKQSHTHPQLFQAIATHAQPILHTFNAQEYSNLLNAYAKLDHAHPILFQSVATAALPKINTFTTQNMATTLNAYAKMDHPCPHLFQTMGNAAIPILSGFSAQELAITVNAYAKLNYPHPELFQNVGEVALRNMHKFEAQGLSITVNAYAKLEYPNPPLFQAVATAALPILHTFNAQALANTVNAFAKMELPNEELFVAVASAAIPIIDTFNAQELANTINAYVRVKLMTGEPTERLFAHIARSLVSDTRLWTWSEHLLVEVGYAFMKARHTNWDLLDMIGRAITNKESVELDAREIGNLAACFSHRRVSCSETVLHLICESYQRMDCRTIELQSVADVAGVIWMAQRLHVSGTRETKLLIDLAIAKVADSRPEDVRDVLLGFDRAFVPDEWMQELLLAYRPYYHLYFWELSGPNRGKIRKIYGEKGILVDDPLAYRKSIDIWP